MGKKLMIFAGVTTLLQAGTQAAVTSLAIAQYFCIIDFLRELPNLLFIRILYFHNPDQCGTRINIGQVIDDMVNQAFVLLTREPLTVTRTFIINCTLLALSVLWIISSCILLAGGARNEYSRPIRWPWIVVSIAVCAVDLVATVIFANDSFHTRTLNAIMDYIGGSVNGTGNIEINTSAVAWIMVVIYARFVIFFFLNVLLIVLVALNKNISNKKLDVVAVETQPEPLPVIPEAPIMPAPLQEPTSIVTQNVNEVYVEEVEIPAAQESNTYSPPNIVPEFKLLTSVPLSNITEASSDVSRIRDFDDMSMREDDVASTSHVIRNEKETVANKIPRAGFSQAFRNMKKLLFAKDPAPKRDSLVESVEVSPDRSPRIQHQNIEEKKRAVNFPDNLLSLPQRLENMIAEQQRRLDRAVIDTAGRASAPRVTQSLPQLNENNEDASPVFNKGRRGTAAELQGQLPWAYIPASAHRMRDQLPPDEDLPPVPLPDYTAIPSFRKASVHRATSSLSSLTQKKHYMNQLPHQKPTISQTDVLY